MRRQKAELSKTWDGMIQQLKDYKTETGNLIIPLSIGFGKHEHTELFKWVIKVWRYMKDYYDINNDGNEGGSTNGNVKIMEITTEGTMVEMRVAPHCQQCCH